MSELPSYTAWPKEFETRYKSEGYWAGASLFEILKKQAFLRGAKVALIDKDRSVTYAELLQVSEKLSHGLSSLGLSAGDRVVVHLTDCIEFFELFFAFAQLGVIPVLALPLHGAEEIEKFCVQSEASAYFYSSGHDHYSAIARTLLNLKTVKHVVSTGTNSQLGLPMSYLLEPVAVRRDRQSHVPTALALIQLSGGTTGTPKLIPRTHDDYFYSVRASAELCELSENTKYLSVLPLAHNFSLSSPGSLGVLYSGGTVVVSENSDPQHAFRLIEKYKIDITALVPPLAKSWLSSRRSYGHKWDLASLKLIQVGGAKLNADVASQIEPVFRCTLQQVFGMAEGLVSYTRLGDSDDLKYHTQGRPLCVDDEVRIVDDTDQPVMEGCEGHVIVRGPYTIRGYYKSEAINREKFTADGFYRTGDIAKRLPSGHLVVTGRSKDIINRGGEKISYEEVESAVVAHPWVFDVAVVSVPDAYLGERICAALMLQKKFEKKSMQCVRKDLVAHFTKYGVAKYKIPDCFILCSEFPKTKVGKIDRKSVRLQALEQLRIESYDELIEVV